VRQAAEAAASAGVGRLILFHHDPSHDDSQVRRLEGMAREIFPRSEAAYEGLEVRV
jgi:ribonuclease BN (tRNA processing enzyme)